MYIIKIDFATPTYDEMMRMRYEILMEPQDLDWQEDEFSIEENFINYGLFDHNMQLMGAYQFSTNLQDEIINLELKHIFVKSDENSATFEVLLKNHFNEITERSVISVS